MRSLYLFAALPLAACTASPPAESTPPQQREPGGCDAEPAGTLIGQKATATSGASALELTGAQSLRWGPPGVMWTMDYRPDRVNVRYDEGMTITEITCG